MMKWILFVLLLMEAMLASCQTPGDSYKTPMRERLVPLIADAYENSDWERIVLLADSLIDNGEVYDDVIIAYAEAQEVLGNASRAVQFLLEDLTDEGSPNKKHYIYNELGDAYQLLEDYDKAVFAYEGAIRLQPNYVRPMVSAGDVYVLLGDTIKALSHYMNAAQLFNKNKVSEGLLSVGPKMINIAPDEASGWHVMANGFGLIEDYDREEECLMLAIDAITKGNDDLTEEDSYFVRFYIKRLAYTRFNGGKYKECINTIDWLRENADIDDWEDDLDRIYNDAKEMLEK